MKRLICLLTVLALALPMSVVVGSAQAAGNQTPILLYQGHASLRIVTPEGTVFYIDPYISVTEGYDLPADVILVTDMRHRDHNHLDSVINRAADCRVITPSDMMDGDQYLSLEIGSVQIEAVEAGYNSLHDTAHCVGYILTFSNGATLYVTGDTAQTPTMPLLAQRNLDYAFFCCDGVYTMTMEQAIKAAEMVSAKHSIPYHMSIEKLFDADIAAQFQVEGSMVLAAGESVELVHEEAYNEAMSMKSK